jgi:hypothetical protein
MADTNSTMDQGEQVGDPQAGNSLQSELELARAELKRVQLEAEQQKFVNQRQRNENDEYRRQLEAHRKQVQVEMDPDARAIQKNKELLEEIKIRQGITEYKINNPDWQKYEERVQAILSDPVRSQEVAAYGPDNIADANKIYTNAKRLVELEELRAAKAQSAEVKEASGREQERQKGLATISGTAASEGEEQIDISKMSSDDMLRAGLVDQDPRDPISPLHPK